MTPRKRWPSEAEYARTKSIGEAHRGLEALDVILRGNTSQAELYKKLAEVQNSLHEIRYSLTAVGPGKGNGSSCANS